MAIFAEFRAQVSPGLAFSRLRGQHDSRSMGDDHRHLDIGSTTDLDPILFCHERGVSAGQDPDHGGYRNIQSDRYGDRRTPVFYEVHFVCCLPFHRHWGQPQIAASGGRARGHPLSKWPIWVWRISALLRQPASHTPTQHGAGRSSAPLLEWVGTAAGSASLDPAACPKGI